MKKPFSILSPLFLLISIPLSLTSCTNRSAISNQDVKNLTAKIDNQQENFNQLNNKFVVHEDNLTQLTKYLESVIVEIKTLCKNIKFNNNLKTLSNKENIKNLKQRIEEQEKEKDKY